MKNFGYFFTFLTLFATINTYAISNNKKQIYDNLNTRNFVNLIDEENIKNIKSICSYDYCDFLRDEHIEKSLEIFTNKYLNTINDEETKNLIKVKGIKITDIIYEN